MNPFRFGAAVVFMALPTMIFAQVPPAGTAPVQTEALEAVIVTAEKRSENLQDVPISVTGLTSSAIEAGRFTSTKDLQLAVPALQFDAISQYGQPYIRGVGSNLTQAGAEPGVATYIDGVYQSTILGNLQSLLGMERVEVLEGPQGTLYGRNAVGGAINLYTMTPTHDLDVAATVTGGNHARQEVSAHISGGLTDTLAAGVYLAETTRNTYLNVQHNLSLLSPALQQISAAGFADNEFSKEKAYGIRLKAVWTPNDVFKLTGGVYFSTSTDPEGGEFRNVDPYAAGFLFYPPNLPHTVSPYLINSDTPQYSDIQQYGATFREELDLGWAKLLGISGYNDLLGNGEDDVDATFAPLVYASAPHFGDRSQQFSQELQLISPEHSTFQWIVGAFYFSEIAGFYPDTTTSAILFQPSTTYANDNFGKTHTHSYALFGQATTPLDNIAQGLRLTLGGRYTYETKNWYGAYQENFDLSGALVPGSVVTFQPATRTWRSFTPKVTLDYKIGDTLVYISYSQGFKAGLFNIAAPSTPGPVNPETLGAYEIGSKSEFADGRFRVNTSAFWYDYKNLQVSRTDEGAGSATTLQNAGEATMYGFEASVAAKASQHLTLTASLAALHSVYDRFTGAAGFIFNPGPNPGFNTSVIADATGNQLDHSPKFVENVAAEYDYPMPNGANVHLSANAYFNSGFFWDSLNQLRQSSYHLIGASAEYRFPDGHWAVRAWGTNLTNTLYENNELAFPFGETAQDAPPRMYGVTIDYRFKK